MVQYSADGKTAAYCGYRFRKDPKTGYFLCTKKTEIGRRERLHCFVYRREHDLAAIPEGYQVHHKDADKNNNEPFNLELLTASEHQRTHSEKLTPEQRQFRRDNFVQNAVPASKLWHGSKAGHDWHVEHGKTAMQNREPRQYNCDNCGKSFETKRIFGESENHFCGNACKSAYRRKAGVDNVKRICAVCGKDFITSKYSKAVTCSFGCCGKYRKMRNG